MNKKNIIFLIICVSMVFSFSFCQAETRIPSIPLQGMEGLKKAIEIQIKTKKPIILWSSWRFCSSCSKVKKWFSGQEVTENLKNYPRVILSAKGRRDEQNESERMGFTGGHFYIIYDYNAKSYKSVWAWEPGTHNIKGDLLSQLKSKAEQH